MQLPTDWLNDPEQVKLFEQRMRAGRMPRRQFMALMGALGAAAAAAACGPTPTPTSAPAGGAATTPTRAAGPTATAPSVGGGTAVPTQPVPVVSPAAAPRVGSPSASPGAAQGPVFGGATLSNWPADLPQPTDMAQDQTYRSYASEEPSGFDYNKDLYATGTTAIWEGLLRFDPDFNLAPGSAEGYETKENGSVYTFKISEKAVWNNGDPVTAQDYVWSWTRQLDPATAATYAGFLLDIKNAESFNSKKGATAQDLGLKAVDNKTLEVTLEGPRGFFPILAAYVAAYPAHRPSVEQYGDKWTDPNETKAPIVSTGPFVLTKWEHQRRFEVERNERYATNPKPRLQKITYPIIPRSAGLGPYEAGEVDVASFQQIPVGDYPRLQQEPLKSQSVKFSTDGLFYLVPEADKPPFTDKRVRNAMQHAVNREQLIRVIQNLGDPAHVLMPPTLPYHIDAQQFPEFKQRVEFSKQAALDALKGTPYEGGRGWPPITMAFRQEGAIPKTAAEFIQRQLRENLNMDVQLEEQEPRTFRDNMYNRQLQLIFIRWYMDFPDPHNFYHTVFYSRKSSGLRQAYSNPTYDDLVNRAAAETDVEKRAALYRDAEKILQEEGVYVPLWYSAAYNLYKPPVGGVPQNSRGGTQPAWNIFIDDHRTIYKKRA